MTTITEPGIYPDLDFDAYLADPVDGGSLSHSGAKTILKTPALFAWEREHGRASKPAFDLGHAAHRAVLGDGLPIVRIDADSWRTKAAKEAAEEARAAGAVPLLSDDCDTVEAMADAIRAHPIASTLLANGQPEVSAFAPDEQTGIMLRARFDILPPKPQGRRLILPDYKTCVSADPVEFAKSAANYGYAMQDAWYSAIARSLGLAEDVAFVFVCQEKSAPYLVNVIQLDVIAKRIGAIQMRQAINLYAACTASGEWPGYPSEVALTSLPIWFERQFEDQLNSPMKEAS